MQHDEKQQLAADSPHNAEPPFSTTQFMLILQLGIFIPLLGPIVVALIGILNNSSKEGRQLIWAGLGLLLLHIAMLTMIFALPAFREAKKEAAVRDYAYDIQLAYVTYTYEHEGEPPPLDLGPVYSNAKLGQPPINPYTGESVKAVEFSDKTRAGNFTILPLHFPERPGGAKPYEFYIFFHGEDDSTAADFSGDGVPDNLILTLDSGFDYTSLGCFGPPPLDEVRHLVASSDP